MKPNSSPGSRTRCAAPLRGGERCLVCAAGCFSAGRRGAARRAHASHARARRNGVRQVRERRLAGARRRGARVGAALVIDPKRELEPAVAALAPERLHRVEASETELNLMQGERWSLAAGRYWEPLAAVERQFAGVLGSTVASTTPFASPAVASTLYFGVEPGCLGARRERLDFARAVLCPSAKPPALVNLAAELPWRQAYGADLVPLAPFLRAHALDVDVGLAEAFRGSARRQCALIARLLALRATSGRDVGRTAFELLLLTHASRFAESFRESSDAVS